jgi:hypothetical protein
MGQDTPLYRKCQIDFLLPQVFEGEVVAEKVKSIVGDDIQPNRDEKVSGFTPLDCVSHWLHCIIRRIIVVTRCITITKGGIFTLRIKVILEPNDAPIDEMPTVQNEVAGEYT